MRQPLVVPIPTVEELAGLDRLYRSTRDVRVRTRVQMILLAAEQRMTAGAIARIVRESDQTVRNWITRYLAEGVEGLKDRPMPGAPRSSRRTATHRTRRGSWTHKRACPRGRRGWTRRRRTWG